MQLWESIFLGSSTLQLDDSMDTEFKQLIVSLEHCEIYWAQLPDLFLFIFYLYECFTLVYVCAPCTCSACRGQRRASDPLEIESQIVVNHHVDART